MASAFRRGVFVADINHSSRYRCEHMSPPKTLYFPLTSDMSTSLNVGDTVDVGSLLASSQSLRIFSSVSGRVIDISEASGVRTVVVENDFEDRTSPDVRPFTKKLGDATSDEIFEIIERLGITDLPSFSLSDLPSMRAAVGGAKHLYVSCLECEPSVSATTRLLLENPTAILNGAKILLKALGLRRADIVLDDGMHDVVTKLTALIGDNKLFRVRTVRSKYPMSNARQLLYALNYVEIPMRKNPVDVGSFTVTATAAVDVFNAFATGMPVTERIVTVGGDCLKKPWNIVARVGTPLSEVVAFCGGTKKTPSRVIFGGLMNGYAVESPESPILPSTSAVTLLSKSYRLSTDESVCIHCGRCADVCPMRLLPALLAKYGTKGDYATCGKLGVTDCIECGCCSYVCPGNMPLVETISRAKRVVAASRAETEVNSTPEVEVKAEVEPETDDMPAVESEVEVDENIEVSFDDEATATEIPDVEEAPDVIEEPEQEGADEN